MIDLQQFLVADRIAQLDDEAAALRAERRRGHGVRDAADTGTPVRVRVGRLLVGLGTAIAGPSQAAEDGTSLPNAA